MDIFLKNMVVKPNEVGWAYGPKTGGLDAARCTLRTRPRQVEMRGGGQCS